MANVDDRIILGNKKRTHNNMDESQRHSDNQKKPDTERVHTLWFHLHEIQKQTKLTYIKKSE